MRARFFFSSRAQFLRRRGWGVSSINRAAGAARGRRCDALCSRPASPDASSPPTACDRSRPPRITWTTLDTSRPESADNRPVRPRERGLWAIARADALGVQGRNRPRTGPQQPGNSPGLARQQGRSKARARLDSKRTGSSRAAPTWPDPVKTRARLYVLAYSYTPAFKTCGQLEMTSTVWRYSRPCFCPLRRRGGIVDSCLSAGSGV